MATKDSLSPSLIDKRVIERNIKKGLVTREAFDKHLSALPDVADQAETMKAKLGEEEVEDIADDSDLDDEGGEENDDDAG